MLRSLIATSQLGKPLTLLIALWVAISPEVSSLRAQEAQADLFQEYTAIYNSINETEKAEKQKKIKEAIAGYQSARTALLEFQKKHPNWNPNIVNFRLKFLNDRLAKLDPSSVDPSPESPTEEEMEEPGVGMIPSVPLTGGDPGMADPAGGVTSDVLMENFRAIGEQLQAIQREHRLALEESARKAQESDQMRAQLMAVEDEIKSAQGKVALAEKERQQALDELIRIKTEAEKNTAMNDESRILLETELKAAQNDLKEKTKIADEASEVQEKLQKQVDDLAAKLETSEKGKKEAESNLANFVKMAGSDGLEGVMKENTRLKNELSEAMEQVKALKTDNEAKTAEIATLTQKLEKIEVQLADLKVKNEEDNAKLASMAAEHQKLESALKEKSPESALLAQENKVLRESLVARMRQQGMTRMANLMIAEELEKNRQLSEDLKKTLHEVSLQNISLTAEEKKLKIDPEIEELLKTTKVHTTLMTSATGEAPKASDAAAGDDLNSLLLKGETAFNAGHLQESIKFYQDALRVDGKNARALISLSQVHHKLGNKEEASAQAEKAVSLHPKDAEARLMMGVIHYSSGKNEQAMKELEESVKLNPQNAMAWQYIGVIASHLKDSAKAVSALNSVIAIDPKNSKAHYNLSVHYATSTPPDWSKCRAHYKLAVDYGAPKSPEIERLLLDHGGLDLSTQGKEDSKTLSTPVKK